LFLSALCASAAAGQETPSGLQGANLLAGWRTGTGTQMAALHLALADGWKTYWRAPGEAGIPPHFDWTGSQNIAGVAFHWPAPTVFDLNGFQTFGFSHDLVLPIEFTPVDPAQPIHVRARIDLGVCEEICVPVTIAFDETLPAGGLQDARIATALAAMPKPASGAGLSAVRCELEPIRDGLRLTARLSMPPLGADEVAIVEAGTGDIWVSSPETTRQGEALVSVVDLVPANAQPFALDRSTVVVTVLAGDRAVEQRGCQS